MKTVKKNLLRLIVLGGLLLNGSTALSQSNGEYNNMSKDITKFDIQAFEQYKTGDYWIQNFPDGTTIRQSKFAGIGYKMEITNIKSPFSENRVFNFQGVLVSTARFFHGFPIGTSIYHDGKGNIISKEEHDQPFPFSIDDVAKKMRAEYKVDIMNREAVPIVRRAVDQINLHIPYYIVYVTDSVNHQLIGYLIHGATGELLLTKATDIYGNDTWILKSYADTLKQKKPKQ